MDDDNILTITQLNTLLKNSIKKIGQKITVKGEINNYRGKYSNTIYASLKDETSSINIIRFKATEDVKNGDKVVINGSIDFYTKNGDIQLICSKIEIEGEGDIIRKLEKLKVEFEKKGYFNNKKTLPTINSVGIITSKDGAALQDILYVLNNNKFEGKVYVKNSPVQGNDCPKGLCNGIRFFNNFLIQNNRPVDLIMITRGGGSTDDLMGFSDPSVVEEIYKSNIYVMSAVGHEIDNMLSDYVANIRAPTPSIGAEMICKSCPNIMLKLEVYNHKKETYNRLIKNKIEHLKKHIISIRYKMYNDIYYSNNRRINNMQNKITQMITTKINKMKKHVMSLRNKLHNDKYYSNNRRINVMQYKITQLVTTRINKIKNNLESIKSNINIIKSMKNNLDMLQQNIDEIKKTKIYNCNILSKNKIITNINDIENGTYTLDINGQTKKIEIKII